ncbi:small ribosomal subunit Rsm22 family protein [Streptomyces sp. NBC_01142]|uniref:small ribosomal subunit Rsm22 family protein n=1 Tax=Streptomyces sp. NBC_01142 TaxID=2975865 RepID=UPI00225AF1EB|nr:small ribosomal subunit Rsm22 family protein [Streptomyces sp. NBC_01142]MCX4822689.1 small ribosomal subunit Rsm22 family protein [Streptomyces sp. NBC_01142]
MNATLPTAEALRGALAGLLDGLPPTQAALAVERLIANYRGTTPTDAPVLRDRSDVVAYAAYRMPATFEAVRSALAALRAAAPDWSPATHTDIGGGTGAASWAVAEAWEEDAPRTTVLDWAEPALALGRELAVGSQVPALGAVEWQRARISSALHLENTDLVTVSYVLKELTAKDRTAVVTEAARAARAVVIVEPGTPDGYERIIEARDRLIEAGMRIAAPCPHSAACPIEPGTDWCHFAARVSRSSLHRQVKGGSLPYEDEKFSYVAAVRFPAEPVGARVTRKPQIRKGLVLLDLCTDAEELRRETVAKRHGALYRAARDVAWGDEWPRDERPRGASDG